MVGVLVAAAACVGPRDVDSLAVPVHVTTESSPTSSSDEPTETTQPLEPVEYAEGNWAWDGGADIVAETPVGWTQVDREPGWWDLRDPTEQVVLRLQVAQAGPPAEAATAELQRLAPAQGFELLDQRELTSEAESENGWTAGYEIHYRYDRDGSPRVATLRYLGTLEATFGAVALLTPPELHDEALPVLDRASRTIRWVG